MSNSNLETLLKFYESARQEMMSRIQLRENSLMIFLGSVGALAAAAIQANQPIFLLIIPYLTLGISMITLHHNYVIGSTIIYCAKELQKDFEKLGITVTQWDISKTRLKSSKSTRLYRLWGDIGLILTPALLAIIINYKSWISGMEYKIAMSIGVICIVFSFICLKKTLNLRHKVFGELEEKAEGQNPN